MVRCLFGHSPRIYLAPGTCQWVLTEPVCSPLRQPSRTCRPNPRHGSRTALTAKAGLTTVLVLCSDRFEGAGPAKRAGDRVRERQEAYRLGCLWTFRVSGSGCVPGVPPALRTRALRRLNFRPFHELLYVVPAEVYELRPDFRWGPKSICLERVHRPLE